MRSTLIGVGVIALALAVGFFFQMSWVTESSAAAVARKVGASTAS